MGLITVNAGRNSVSLADSFFPNYGTQNTSYNQQHFSFPVDGYIKYISMNYRPNNGNPNTNDQPFTLLNDTIPQTYDSIITLLANETNAFEKYDSSTIAFTAGDRFRFKNNLQYAAAATNVTFFAELPTISNNVISVIGSMRGSVAVPKSEFTIGNEPYSFGRNNLLNTVVSKTSIGFRLPVSCSLVGMTLTLPGVQGTDATLNIQQNGINIGIITVTVGNTVGIGSYGLPISEGDRITLECATTNSFSSSTVLMIFEV